MKWRKRGKKKKELTSDILFRKLAKHAVFILVSILITNIFLNWIIGPAQLWSIVTEPISKHFAGRSPQKV